MKKNHHQANVSDAFKNMANVVTTDENTVQQLTASNKKLTEQLKVDFYPNKVLKCYYNIICPSKNGAKETEPEISDVTKK